MRSSFVFFLVTTLLVGVVMETPIGISATCTNAQFVKIVGPGTVELIFRQMEVFAGSTNVASGGTATQVTTATGNVASNCIDGSTALCKTTSLASPWWEVDLGSTHCIDTIAFYNYEGVSGFNWPEVLKGGSVIVYDASHTALHTYTIAGEVFELYHVNSAAGTSAQYVRIDAARSLIMSMREVLVITGSGTNVASSGTASQGPSTSGSKFASFCIDGNTVHDVANLCELDAHADTYWEVDLGSTITDLARVVVYNRLDAYNDNLERNPVILLDANRKPVAVKYLSAGRNTETVHFATQPHCGIRYVRVENGKADNMQMQELMLFNNGVNIALGKTATQSSTPDTNVAANCVDGNPLGSSLNTGPIYSACRTNSGYSEWWEVDLGSDQCADFVHTYASQGYWAEMNNAAIILLDSNRVPLNSFENDFQEVQTLGIINPSWDGSPVAGCKTARYLRVDRTNANSIAIAEMQIWAGLINIGLVSKLLDSSAPNVADDSKDRAVNGGLWISGWQGFRSTAIAGAYWELDFGKDYCVDRVVWYGQTTLISEQEGCTIHLMDSGRVDVQTWLPTPLQPVAVYLVDGVSASDEVRAFVLKNNRADWFQYREFQVMKAGVNIALNQVTSQNDVSLTRTPDIAVDGDTSQTLFAQCADASQWHHFNLFLSQTYSSVDSVFIHNFLDLTTRIRMDTAVLMVLDGNFIPTKTIPMTQAAVSYFNLTSAAKPNCGVRYVRVQAHSDHQFQELRAYGGGVNLALGKTVSQTTDLNGGTPASVCTDNYLDFVSPSLMCASTATADAYWELDFGSDVCLDFIHFVSRSYSVSPNEWGSVLLLDSNQLPIQSFTLGKYDQENFIVNEAYHPATTGCVEARYLRIERLTADSLGLEEIMVFSGPLNVALGKSITSSSVLTHPMEQCVDGTYGPTETYRICLTASSATEWIEVDFGQSYCVSHVVLYAMGTHLFRLDNCKVTLLPDGKATTAAEWNTNGDYVQTFYPSSVPFMNSTRFVRVELALKTYLHMREVETWMSGSNVALSKNGAQYNDMTPSQVAGKALDGVKLPSESSISHADFAHRTYWQVDLAASYDLDSVLIYNRVITPERLLGSSLVLLNEHHVPIRSYGLNSYFLQPLALVAQEPQMCGIRYVRIEIGQSTYLFFNQIIIASNGNNIALGKTANYDFNHPDWPPGHCVDGIPGWGTHTDFLCHSGLLNTDVYYEIDLGADHCVDYAHIMNRWDYPAFLASSAIMFLSSARQPLRVSHFTSKYEQWVPINTSTELGHPGCVNSQYIRFQGNTGTYILVNEIQAYEGHANVAVGKTVTMSGFEGGFHDGCMDGATRDDYGGYCQAQATANNWMMIDLGREYCINKVVLTSHKFYANDRFANNDVLLLDSSSSAVRTWPSISAQFMAIFDADNIPKNDTIRYVQVQVEGNTYIALREVKVIRNGVNIATSGTAHISVVEPVDSVASVCIDGSTLHGASVHCHSALSFDSWFVIDLGQEYDGIDAVLVYPYRSVDYAANAGVMLFNELWVPQRSFTMKGATGVEIFYVNSAAAEANCGIRYVRVEIGKAEILNFMELEVYSNQVNVAKDKPATQSADESAAYVATNCADGYRERNGTFSTAGEGTMCHTLSSLDSWWEVDLQADYCVDYADFFDDYGPLSQNPRINGATVQFLNSNREAVRLFRLEAIAVNRMMLNASYRETPQDGCQMGRYVRIERSGVAGYIVAVEIEVYEGDFNVALGKTTTVSALEGGGYLERYATDGLTATDHTLLPYFKAHTTTAVDAWLEVDLGQEYCVDHIVWYCQVGYAASRKAGTTMKLLDTARATVKTWTPYLDPRDTSGNAYMDVEVFHVSTPRNETAYIQAKQGLVNDQVVLREVQGWSGGVNVAEGKRSYQYDDLNSGVKAAKCNDGSYADTETCQTTASYRNWWEVDLGGSFTLDRVMVFAGETAAFQTKMDGTDIILFNARRVPIRTYNAYKAGVTPLQVAEEAPLGCGVRYLTLQTSLSSAISMGEILAFKDGVNYATAAHGATITSSTTDGSNTAAKCIDGVRNSALSPHLSTCTTLTGLNEQIEVDLGQERCIDAVELVNRDDYKVHWQHSHILLAQSSTREIRSAFPVRELASERFLTNRNWRPQGNTGCQTARKVRVERTTADVLSFTQWQVIVGGTNVALGLPCTKSSAHANDNADFCGVTDGSQWRVSGYYAYTASSATEWIELDLQEDYCIDSIVMTGPQSAGVAYQANLVLKDSSDVTVKTMPFTGDGTTWVQHFFMNETSADTAYTRSGRFVVVRPDGAVALQLREVVVERNGANLATAGTAGQATDSGSSTANCNDGDTTTAAFCLTTATAHSQYVLDLGSTKTDIDSITVYNSHSVTPANLAKAFVFLINEEGSIIRSSMLTTSALTQWSLGNVDVTPPPTCGFRYIRIEVDTNSALGLSEVYVISPTGANLALGKTASQSSTAPEAGETYGPQVCNDGDNATVSSPEKACLTTASWDAYWQVDLGQEECVDDVIIYNRGGTYTTSGYVSLLSGSGAPVRIFPKTSAQVQLIHTRVPYVMSRARYVQVLIQTGTLHMREVEILSGGRNIALYSPAWMSSVKSPPNADGNDASICVNGDTVSQAGNAVCQTDAGDSQSWTTDLGVDHCIDTVKVFNRIDSGAEAALNRASVMLYDQYWRLHLVDDLTSAAIQDVAVTGLGDHVQTVVHSGLPFLDVSAGIAYEPGASYILLVGYTTHNIMKVSLIDWSLTTFAGPTDGTIAFADGVGDVARFNYPYGMVWDPSRTAYMIGDRENEIIRKMTTAASVTTFAGAANVGDFINGPVASARFNGPTGIAVFGSTLVIGDQNNNAIRSISVSDEVTTLVSVSMPIVMTTSSSYIYTNDGYSIVRVDAVGTKTTVAGSVGGTGFINGYGTSARFGLPIAGTLLPDGTLLISCRYYNVIRHINLDTQLVSTFVGSGSGIDIDGYGTGASLDAPYGLQHLDTINGEYLFVGTTGNLRTIGSTARCSTETAPQTATRSTSVSTTITPPDTPSATDTVTVSPPPTATQSESTTLSSSLPLSVSTTPSVSATITPPDTPSATDTVTVSPPPTATQSESHTWGMLYPPVRMRMQSTSFVNVSTGPDRSVIAFAEQGAYDIVVRFYGMNDDGEDMDAVNATLLVDVDHFDALAPLPRFNTRTQCPQGLPCDVMISARDFGAWGLRFVFNYLDNPPPPAVLRLTIPSRGRVVRFMSHMFPLANAEFPLPAISLYIEQEAPPTTSLSHVVFSVQVSHFNNSFSTTISPQWFNRSRSINSTVDYVRTSSQLAYFEATPLPYSVLDAMAEGGLYNLTYLATAIFDDGSKVVSATYTDSVLHRCENNGVISITDIGSVSGSLESGTKNNATLQLPQPVGESVIELHLGGSLRAQNVVRLDRCRIRCTFDLRGHEAVGTQSAQLGRNVSLNVTTTLDAPYAAASSDRTVMLHTNILDPGSARLVVTNPDRHHWDLAAPHSAIITPNGCFQVSWLDANGLTVPTTETTLSVRIDEAPSPRTVLLTSSNSTSGWSLCDYRTLMARQGVALSFTTTLSPYATTPSSHSLHLNASFTNPHCHPVHSHLMVPVEGCAWDSAATCDACNCDAESSRLRLHLSSSTALPVAVAEALQSPSTRCNAVNILYSPSARNGTLLLQQCSPQRLHPTSGYPLLTTPQPLDVLFTDGRMIADPPAVDFASDTRVWITAVSGCTDAYPSTGECPATTSSNRTKTITITGLNFNSSMSLQFASSTAPAITCDQLVLVTTTQLECRAYVGYGGDRTLELSIGATVIPALGPSAVRLSFSPGREQLCGVNATGYLCGGHGSCDATLGRCVCLESASSGYWGGAACDQCNAFYNSSDCTLQCPAADTGYVCSGHGACFNAACSCLDGYFGSSCEQQCPGYGSPCSGHGTCNNTDATCICHNSTSIGFWDDQTVCSSCVYGFSGTSCDLACPMNSSGVVCSDAGACSEGKCVCNDGYCGDSCETYAGACFTCNQGLYGPSCDRICPGGVTSPCGGRGVCDAGKLGSGKCSCYPGYAGLSCELLCDGSAANPCSGNGICSDVNGRCTCAATYGSVDCSVQCPGASNSNPCSGHGVCNDGSTGDGACVCAFGYTGSNCSSICPGGLTNPCSKHGSCLSTGTCECHRNIDEGYWSGSACDSCLTTWHGARCNKQCPASLENNIQCGGHGVCNASVQCSCFLDDTLGFWDGDACDKCLNGYYGDQCSGLCPGGSCTKCHDHGTCSEGRSGNGSCVCHSNTVQGFWSAAGNCSDCATGYYGYYCTSNCPTSADNNQNCGGRGTCDEGLSGNGQCTCTYPYTTTGSGSCDGCVGGYYSPSCVRCPVASFDSSLTCSGNGSCSDGWSGDGTCSCNVGFGGDNCEISCPIANGQTCAGHGSCTISGCVCFGNWSVQSDGTCSDCASNRFGASCSSVCDVCASDRNRCNSGQAGDGSCICARGYWGPTCDYLCPGGTEAPCSNHGTCDMVTGQCTCYQDFILGYWSGYSCSYCLSTYESTHCNITCPVDGLGKVCSDRASCWSGACTDCRPKDGDLHSAYCGAACDIGGVNSCSSSCPAGFWGGSCDQHCPGYDGVDTATTCSGRGTCGVDGQCYCNTGSGGPSCSFTCAAARDSVGTLRTCGAHGDCVADNTCECYFGFVGYACHIACPLGTNDVACSGKAQGKCGEGGACSCINGWVGDSCSIKCPNSNTTHQCSAHGSCDSAGTCHCDSSEGTGYWDGTACHHCRFPYFGTRCTEQCSGHAVAGVGRTCVCEANWGGSDCSVSCPGLETELGVCTGHGACNDGSAQNATCSCTDDWFGNDCFQGCTVKQCVATTQLVNPMCDNDGNCVCQRTSSGSFDGPRCEDCFLGYWGLRCNLRCQCNEHGSCDRNSGVCKCFQDSHNGFWAGLSCDVCSDGYIGTDCRSRNIQLSVNKHRVGRAPVKPHHKSDPTFLFQDDAFNAWYLGNRPLVVMNATTHPPAFATHLLFNGTDSDAVVDIGIHNATHLRVLLNTSNAGDGSMTTSYLLPRGLGVSYNSPAAAATTSRRHAQVQATSTTTSYVLYTAVTSTGQVITLHADGGVRISDPSLLLVANWTAHLDNIYHAEVIENDTAIVVTGSRRSSSVAALTYWTALTAPLPLSASTVWKVYNDTTLAAAGRQPLAACQTALFGCRVAHRCRLYRERLFCLLDSSSGPVIASFPLFSATDISSVTQLIYRTPSIFHTTAVGLDIGSATQLLLVAFSTTGDASTVLKINLAQTSVTGEIKLTKDKVASVDTGSEAMVVTGFRINSISRELYAVVSLEYQYLLISVNLFGVEFVFPDVVDAAGGTLVYIQGEGFPRAASETVFCNFGSGRLAPAAVLSEEVIRCTATEAGAGTGGCLTHNFDIHVGDRLTATTNVPVKRPISVTIDSAHSSDGVAFSDVTQQRSITISGIGFVPSDNATCAVTYGSHNPSEWKLFAQFHAVVINTSHAYCVQTAGTESSPAGAHLRYSHDAVVFSRSSVRYSLVGSPASLRIVKPTTADRVTVKSASSLPSVTVHVTDTNGNSVFQLDQLTRAVTLSAQLLTPQDAFLNIPATTLSFGNNTELTIPSSKGVTRFQQLVLAEPPHVGSMSITVSLRHGTSLWLDIADITVLVGDAFRLALAVDSSTWRIGTFEEVALAPTPAFKLEDAAGNEVSDLSQFPQSVTVSYTYDSTSSDKNSSSTLRQIVSDVDLSSRRYIFEGVKTRGRYGGTYFLQADPVPLFEGAPTLQSFKSRRIKFLRCDSDAEFGRPGTFFCQPCPMGARCDGTNIVAILPGFWRASTDSYTMYSCTAGACEGGGCLVGYEGRRCSSCEIGFGKAGTSCVHCFSSTLNWLLIIVFVIVVVAMIVVLILNSMGDPDNELGKSKDTFPIVFKMLVTFMQVISQAKDITNPDYSLLSDLFQGQQQASALTTDLPFIQCELRSNFYQQFAAMNVLPLIVGVLCAVLVSSWKLLKVLRASFHAKPHVFDEAYRFEVERNRRDLMQEEAIVHEKGRDDTKLEVDEEEFDQILADVNFHSPLEHDGLSSFERPRRTMRAPSLATSVLGLSSVNVDLDGRRLSGAGEEELASSQQPNTPLVVAPDDESRPRLNRLSLRTTSIGFETAQPSSDVRNSPLVVAAGLADAIELELPIPPSAEDNTYSSSRNGVETQTPTPSNPMSQSSDEPFTDTIDYTLAVPPHEVYSQFTADELPRREADDDRRDAEAEHEDLVVSKLKARGWLSRTVEYTAVTIIVVLFLLYPTLLQTVSQTLQCETLDLGTSVGLQEVLIVDRNIDCTTPKYLAVRKLAIFLLIFWGFGIPAFSLAVVKALSKLTLFGHTGAAHTLFFFMTGGVQSKYWFWEATVMARKALLVMIVVLINEDRFKIYAAVWLMLLFFALQVTVHPYIDVRLSRLETSSLVAIILTFNLLMLQPHFDAATEPALFHGLIVVVIAVNAIMFAAFLYMLIITGRQILRRLAFEKERFFFLQSFFEVSVSSMQSKTEALQRQVERDLQRLRSLRPADAAILEVFDFLGEHLENADGVLGHKIDTLLVEYQSARRTLELSLSRFREPDAALREWYQLEESILQHVKELSSKPSRVSNVFELHHDATMNDAL